MPHLLFRFSVAFFVLAAGPFSTLAQNGKGHKDVHSFANPQHIKSTHLDLDLRVDFEKQALKGVVIHTVERTSKDTNQPLILDTHYINIENVESSTDGQKYSKTQFRLSPPPKAQPYLGSKLVIQVSKQVKKVKIHYTTGEKAPALQWLGPKQTASKKPFFFTQSEPIQARSWIPLQDSPGVRVTYKATVRVPKGLMAVMSASNAQKKSPSGVYKCVMRQKIPSYLIALAVGDLRFASLGERCGVYAEPPVIKKAAREFALTEKMLDAVERRFGKYRWDRYDILVLPPSFPSGGMENPRLNFVTPTILAGDKSLLALVAHEMAHSWSGNLVSNATWRDLWLNEGFTVYLERRILEDIFGRERAMMNGVLGRRDLDLSLTTLKPRDRILYTDLTGRHPREVFTDIPYEKGALFLTHLEKVFGRKKFDAFLKSYFDHFAFRSISTREFVDFLDAKLMKMAPNLASRVPVEQWVYQSKLPKSAPKLKATAFGNVEKQQKLWLQGQIELNQLQDDRKWNPQEWLHFIQTLPDDVGKGKLKQLDKTFGFTNVGNSLVLMNWLKVAIRNDYEPAYPRAEQFLLSMGRRWYLREIYGELAKTREGKKRALKIYAKARASYHPLSVRTVDKLLGWRGSSVSSSQVPRQK